MTCDRAQELFSEYIEGGLDRPVASAMDGHLAACQACRQEVESLRMTWEDLEALPVVAPPPDAVLQTLAAIRQEREEARVAANQPAPWLTWLRSLSPMRVAMATSLATLIVAGAILFPRLGERRLGVPDFPGLVNPVSRINPGRPQPQLNITFQYGAVTRENQHVVMALQSNESLPDAVVTVRRVISQEFFPGGRGTMQPGKPYLVPLDLPRSSTPELLLIDVKSEPARFARRFLCSIPFERRDPKAPVSLTFVETALKDALRQISEKTGRPAVADAALEDRPVTATVTARPADEAWTAVLSPLNLRAVNQQGTYAIVPRE